MSLPPVEEIRRAIRNIPDFPKPGIQFKDITPVLANPELFGGTIDLLTAGFKRGDVDSVPYDTHEQSYDLEYGQSTIAIHTDAVKPGARVLLIDDLLATGGTAEAAAILLQKVGAKILEATFVIELSALKGRQKIQHCPVRSLVVY